MKFESKFQKRFYARLVEAGLDKEYEIAGMKTPSIVLKHIPCGRTFSVRESDFFERGQGCFYCKVAEETNNEYEVISFSTAFNKSTFTVRHNKCGKEFQITRLQYERTDKNHLCRFCNSNRGKRSYTIEELKKRTEEETNGEYILLSDEYVSATSYLKFKHLVCGEEFQMSAMHFFNDKRRCKKCAWEMRKRTTEDFKKQLETYTDEIEILSEYKGWGKNMKFRHKICGCEFERFPKELIKNCRENDGCFCPNCSIESIGEREVEKILKENNVHYVFNKSIEGCKLIRPLRFDFIIYENENMDSIKALVEYDGPQHSNPFRDFGDEKEFLETQKRDAEKNKFCEKNNLKLIRINYNQFQNIAEILKENEII